jgi:methyltransferase-like protein 6
MHACMQVNPSCTATVCDISSTAISSLRAIAQGLPISDNRLTSFVHDIAKPCKALAGLDADLGLLVFTLSAVHPHNMADVLWGAFSGLRPGGALLIRDYGLYDMPSLRFPPDQRLDENLYLRWAFIARLNLQYLWTSNYSEAVPFQTPVFSRGFGVYISR